MLWLFLGFLALVVVVLMLLPLRADEGASADPVSFYKSQLAALEADKPDMEEAEYCEAELELQRRLLISARGRKSGAEVSADGDTRLVQIVAVIVVMAGSAGLYAWLGSPGLPEAPAPARAQFENQVIDDQGTTIAAKIEDLVQQASASPADPEILKEIAAWYREARNFTAAAMAYRELSYLEPENPEWPLRQFEAMNVLHQGQIPPASAIVLDRLVDSAPDHPAVHFYRGLQFKQAGDNERAKAVWLSLKARTPDGAPWLGALNEGLASLDPSLVPELAEQQAVNKRAAEVAEMSPEEQVEFIKGMISNLENRMAGDLTNTEGWLMLARAKQMTGDIDGARTALTGALGTVTEADRPQIQAALDALESK